MPVCTTGKVGSPCVTCPSSRVTALLEKLVRKPSGFNILLIYCMPVICFLHFVFTLANGMSDAKFLSVASCVVLKIFHFCSAGDVAAELVMFHANSVSVYPVCVTVTCRAAEFCPRQRQKLAQRLCKARQVGGKVPEECRWLGSKSCSGWPGSCRLCLVKFNTGDWSSG